MIWKNWRNQKEILEKIDRKRFTKIKFKPISVEERSKIDNELKDLGLLSEDKSIFDIDGFSERSHIEFHKFHKFQ